MPKLSSIKKIRATASPKKVTHITKHGSEARVKKGRSKKTKGIVNFSALEGKGDGRTEGIERNSTFLKAEKRISDPEEEVIKTSSKPLPNKFTARTAIRENERMKLIAQTPAFKENPLEEAHKHLTRMLANRRK